MPVTVILNPRILYNCHTADEVARRMQTLIANLDTEGVEVIGVYPMPAAHPEGDEPQYDVTILLKRTVPATEG
jgi:predicted nuclease with RNAse H fold